jgi:hypothetical protein
VQRENGSAEKSKNKNIHCYIVILKQKRCEKVSGPIEEHKKRVY